MAEISKTNRDILDLPKLRQGYAAGQGSANGQIRTGIEIESWFFNTEQALDGKLQMMSPAESQRVLTRLAAGNPQAEKFWERDGQRLSQAQGESPLVCVNRDGISYQLELSGVLEAATAPIAAPQAGQLLAQVALASQTMQACAAAEGLSYYSGAVPGSIRIADCAANRVQRERLLAEWDKFQSEGPQSPGLRTMGLAASVQASISYRTPTEAGEIITLGNLLTPALYVLFSNTTGFIEGKPDTRAIPRADWWMQHNRAAPRAGIPQPVLSAMFSDTGRDKLLDTWIDYARTVPMVYYWDEKDAPRFDTSPSFNQLAERGLGTTRNFALAESLLWTDVKVIAGQRIELRAPDSGPLAPQAMAMLATSLFANPDLRGDILREIKNESGINATGLKACRAQVALGGCATSFGRITVGQMARRLCDWIEQNPAPGISPIQTRQAADALRSNLLTLSAPPRGTCAIKADLARLALA